MEASGKKIGPVKRIRMKCLDCCAGDNREVRLCPSSDCSLWPYRMGHRPTAAQEGQEMPQNPAPWKGVNAANAGGRGNAPSSNRPENRPRNSRKKGNHATERKADKSI